jgi:porin
VHKGTFASRPQDDVALVVTRQQYSDDALENLRLARAAAGGAGTPQSGQTMMELSYGFAINPHLRIAPSLHYVMHPDQFNAPGRLRDLPNAWVAGLRFDLSL